MSKIKVDASNRVFIRMRKKGVDLSTITDVLKEVNPDASEDELFVFVAECVKNPPTIPSKSQKNELAKHRENESYFPGGCASSSSSSHC